MSYTKILNGLQEINNVISWDTLFIKYNHKVHPNEFICYKFKFSTSDLLTSTIASMRTEFTKIIDNYNHQVETYNGFNSKNVIDKIATSSTVIKDSWDSLIMHIATSDDTTSIEAIKANAYVFVGTYLKPDGTHKNLYLLTRKNPIVNLKKRKGRLFSGTQNTVSVIDSPLIQFTSCFDALVYDDMLYMINLNCESIFNLEHSYKKICSQSLDDLEHHNIIQDFPNYRTFASAAQTPKKFLTYSTDTITKLDDPTYRNKVSTDLHLTLNSHNQFDLTNPNDAKNFTLFICGKTKRNMDNDDLCEVPTSYPINLS